MDDRKRYACLGGPFDDTWLWLGTRATAWLQVGKWRGRYVATKNNRALVWEDADAC